MQGITDAAEGSQDDTKAKVSKDEASKSEASDGSRKWHPWRWPLPESSGPGCVALLWQKEQLLQDSKATTGQL